MEYELTRLLNKWEYGRLHMNFDPVPILKRLCEIMEYEIMHATGERESLKDKCKTIAASEFYQVLLDEYIDTSLHYNHNLMDSFGMNTAAVRLLLCITNGSNIKFDNYGAKIEYGTIIRSVMKWTIGAQEPLRTYSTALLDMYIKNKEGVEEVLPGGEWFVSFLLKRLVNNHIPSKYENFCWPLSPLNEITKQMYLFKILTSLMIKENHVSTLMKDKAFHVLMYCIDGANGLCDELMIEARNYLLLLLKDELFCLKFIDEDGVQIIIRNLRQPLADVTSRCLRNLVINEKAVIYLCENLPGVAQDLVLFALELADNRAYSVKCNGMVICGFTFIYKLMLDEFDANDGLKKLQDLIDYICTHDWADVNLVLVFYKCYIESHLILKYRELCGMIEMPNTFLKTTEEEVVEIIEKITKFLPFDWNVMNKIIEIGSPDAFLKVINYRYILRVSEDMLQNALHVLSIFSFMPKVQRSICKQIEFIGKPTSGIKEILITINVEDEKSLGNVTTQRIQKSALRLLVNCVCAPIFKDGDNSIVFNSWTRTREFDGLLILHELLNPEKKSSHEMKYLICKALYGMARDNEVKIIICSMPNYKKQQLQNMIMSNDSWNKANMFNRLIIRLTLLVQPMDNMVSSVRCAEPKNILTRLAGRELGRRRMGTVLDKKLKYDKFKMIPENFFMMRKYGYKFTCVKFMLNKNNLLICDNEGAFRQIDVNTGELMNTAQTDCFCESIELESRGNVMLTSCWKGSALRSVPNLGNRIFSLEDDKYCTFGNDNESIILASRKQFAKLIDTASGTDFLKLEPTVKNNYEIYKAAFNGDNKQVLFDGVIFDVNSGSQIYRFEKLNRFQNGIYHPNGYEIIINQEIWDLRTLSLLKTVPNFDNRRISFGATDSVMYASPLKNSGESEMYVVDARTYQNISSFKVEELFGDFDVNRYNDTIAIVEHQSSNLESVVRMYQVGRSDVE